MKPMTWALAGKMTVEVLLFLIGYAVLVYGVARFMAWLGNKYPRLSTTHADYYGVDSEAPARELDRYDYDEYEEPLPPAA